jgi:membrane fusion protein (multidrug efflux system)
MAEPAHAQPEASTPQQPSAPESQKPAPMSPRTKRIIAGVVAVLGLAGLGYWLYERHFEETDDAQIDGNISNVSSRVAGTVRSVAVIENQVVRQGELLAELDPSDLEVALAQARANQAQAQAQLLVEDPNVSITQSSNRASLSSASSDVTSAQAAISGAKSDVEQLAAQLAQAEANDKNAQLTGKRAEELIAEKAIPQSDYDSRVASAKASTANVEALRQALASARDRVTQAEAKLSAARSHAAEVTANAPRQIDARRAAVEAKKAQLALAQAQLDEATNNVSYTHIVAPIEGIVGKKAVSVGDRITPGQQLFAVTQTSGLWVTANFRETQLRHLQVGDRATVHVDAVGRDFTGKVTSLGGATGSRLSVLPPENATGNYVKVVQRLPVRIDLDPGQEGLDRLRAGMSVEPKVRIE